MQRLVYLLQISTGALTCSVDAYSFEELFALNAESSMLRVCLGLCLRVQA